MHAPRKSPRQPPPLRGRDWACIVVAGVFLLGAAITIRPFPLLGIDLIISAAAFVAIALIGSGKLDRRR